jgi:hypothetical protein
VCIELNEESLIRVCIIRPLGKSGWFGKQVHSSVQIGFSLFLEKKSILIWEILLLRISLPLSTIE